MLKIRVLSSLVGLALLAAVLLLGYEVLAIGIFAVCIIGLNEFYNAISKAGYKPLKAAGYLSSLLLLTLSFMDRLEPLQGISLSEISLFYAFFILLILFAAIVFGYGKYSLADISLTLFGILYIVVLFSFIPLTRGMKNGDHYIYLIFIGAWATDTFAYFAGRFFGKTRFLPVVSPNKTLEGAVGGVFGCIAGMLAFGVYMNSVSDAVPLYHFILMGVLCGVISQLGDWTASAVKRQVKIKDYGTLMPGHGGVLDRFDSILLVAPVIYFYISYFII